MTVSGPGTPEPRPTIPGVRTQPPVWHPSHCLPVPVLPSAPSLASVGLVPSNPPSSPEPPPHHVPIPTLRQASSAEQLRKEGNELFKCGDYEGALTAYTQALDLGATPQDRAVLHRNRAACHLKLVRAGAAVPLLARPGWTLTFPGHSRLPMSQSQGGGASIG